MHPGTCTDPPGIVFSNSRIVKRRPGRERTFEACAIERGRNGAPKAASSCFSIAGRGGSIPFQANVPLNDLDPGSPGGRFRLCIASAVAGHGQHLPERCPSIVFGSARVHPVACRQAACHSLGLREDHLQPACVFAMGRLHARDAWLQRCAGWRSPEDRTASPTEVPAEQFLTRNCTLPGAPGTSRRSLKWVRM